MSQNTELKAQAKKPGLNKKGIAAWINNCLLYTSDAADEL